MSESPNHRDYGFSSDWDGNGEIYDVERQIVTWKCQFKNLRRRADEAGKQSKPVFALFDADGKESLAIHRDAGFFIAPKYRILEKSSQVGSIFQRSILFTRYEFSFASGSKWKLYLPMFTVWGSGESADQGKLTFRFKTRRLWMIRLTTDFGYPPLMAALAFVTRKKLQCT
jgi:hypothetical protein